MLQSKENKITKLNRFRGKPYLQGGDWLGSTLGGRIFFTWFGLAKKVWLFGCGLAAFLGKNKYKTIGNSGNRLKDESIESIFTLQKEA